VNRKLALFLSVVFQPLIVPTLVFATLFFVIPEATSIPKNAKSSMILLIAVTTLLIPMLSIIGMKMTSTIESYHMNTIRERILPFSMVSLFYIITTYFFQVRLNVDRLLVFTLWVITACIILLTLITFFWKISAHLTGLSGLLAIILVLSIKYNTGLLLYPLVGSILLCGAVGTARLYLNAHRPLEILGGFALGFSVCFVSYYYYLM
jgi:membrane-associated phospholipid phosphatase